MANLRSAFHVNNENHGQGVVHSSKNESARKHSAKKAVFGELKNVIHNQYKPKSLNYGDGATNKQPMQSFVKRTKTEVRQQNVAKPKRLEVIKESKDDEIEMLKYFDFAPICCSKRPKSDRQIWAEMDMFNDSMLDQSIFKDEEIQEVQEVENFYFDDSGVDIDFNASKIFNVTLPTIDSDEEDFLPKPPFVMRPLTPCELPDLGDI
ncbi:uncharacterized protein LOC106082682 [Stomoxys calcitrans]|uniref:uncharacterized protein LOC106082682 n=1 Tax=Stomoxys calcitrans TaxID=35570 RepID=UPI0027E2BD09|nr:uncharacterized protein LOC106082682 [Stomoxys calcitrans]